MFYSDYRVLTAHLSNYILRFVGHYDQYVNSKFIRSVDYSNVVWC
jgi:hypothetical protein